MNKNQVNVLRATQYQAWETAYRAVSRSIQGESPWDHLPAGLAAEYRRRTSAGMRVEESVSRFYDREIWATADAAADAAKTANVARVARASRLREKLGWNN